MLTRDIRYAFRILRKSPLFTTAATLTLAVAIGVNVAVFSVVDAVLLRPLPYPEPDNLALVSRIVRGDGMEGHGTAVDGRTWEAVRDQMTAADRAVFSGWTTGVNLVAGGTTGVSQARHVQQQRVGAGFFRTLGVHPMIGREFSADEDRAGGPPAAILSASLWRNLFGADPAIVGRTIMLRGAPVPVVGVMPDAFQSGELSDVWTPLRPSTTGEGGGENYQILLRLRPGVSWRQADEELARVASAVRSPQADARASITFAHVPLQQGLSEGLQQPLLILWSAVSIVLLVACVNLAGLLLARGSLRAREIATRMALGSGRRAVIRQLLVESGVLAVIGGLGGLAVGWLALDGLTWLARDAYEIWQPVALDARSAAAAGAFSLIACLLFGFGPALQATRGDVQSRLVHASARSIAGPANRWPRSAIVVAQVALGVLLLVAAGLLIRTFTHLRGLDPGFDPENVVTAAVSLEDARYRTQDQVNSLFDRTLASIESAPGVEGAAVALEVPYKRLLNLGFRHLDGPEAAAAGQMTNATYVSPGFFDVMRIPIRRGRAFTAGDRADSSPVAIVSDAFVRLYFKGENPVGRRIAVAGAAREIVGQAGDVQVRPGWGNNGPLSAMPLAYVPAGQVSDGFVRLVHGWFAPTFIVRTRTGAADAAATLRRAVDGVDPLLPFASVKPIADVRSTSLAPQRFLMALLAGLAAATVLLAAIGMHGLIATTVTERTREIGIRLALGATTSQAIRTLTIPALALTFTGIALGLGLSAFAVEAFQSFVWGVSTSDPVTFTLAATILMFVAAAAALLPALRILRLDPAQTLRAE
jgi:predicted permease